MKIYYILLFIIIIFLIIYFYKKNENFYIRFILPDERVIVNSMKYLNKIIDTYFDDSIVDKIKKTIIKYPAIKSDDNKYITYNNKLINILFYLYNEKKKIKTLKIKDFDSYNNSINEISKIKFRDIDNTRDEYLFNYTIYYKIVLFFDLLEKIKNKNNIFDNDLLDLNIYNENIIPSTDFLNEIFNNSQLKDTNNIDSFKKYYNDIEDKSNSIGYIFNFYKNDKFNRKIKFLNKNNNYKLLKTYQEFNKIETTTNYYLNFIKPKTYNNNQQGGLFDVDYYKKDNITLKDNINLNNLNEIENLINVNRYLHFYQENFLENYKKKILNPIMSNLDDIYIFNIDNYEHENRLKFHFYIKNYNTTEIVFIFKKDYDNNTYSVNENNIYINDININNDGILKKYNIYIIKEFILKISNYIGKILYDYDKNNKNYRYINFYYNYFNLYNLISFTDIYFKYDKKTCTKNVFCNKVYDKTSSIDIKTSNLYIENKRILLYDNNIDLTDSLIINNFKVDSIKEKNILGNYKFQYLIKILNIYDYKFVRKFFSLFNKYIFSINQNSNKDVYSHNKIIINTNTRNIYNITLDEYLEINILEEEILLQLNYVGLDMYNLLLELIYINSNNFINFLKTNKINKYKLNFDTSILNNLINDLYKYTIYITELELVNEIVKDYKQIIKRVNLNINDIPYNIEKELIVNNQNIGNINGNINLYYNSLKDRFPGGYKFFYKGINDNTNIIKQKPKSYKVSQKLIVSIPLNIYFANLDKLEKYIEKKNTDNPIEHFESNNCKDLTLPNGDEYVDNIYLGKHLQFKCEDYKKYKLCENKKITDKYISSINNNLRKEAKDVCCVCGGGITSYKKPKLCPGPSPCITEKELCPSICPVESCPGPTPCITDKELCPSDSPGPSMEPCPEKKCYKSCSVKEEIIENDFDKDLTLKVEITVVLKEKINKYFNKLFDRKNIEIIYTNSNNNLLIKLPDFIFKTIDKTKLKIVRKFFQCLYKTHYKENYNKDILEPQIIVEFIPGSLIILIKILKHVKKFTLTKKERDLLEYYNFQRVFFKKLHPITEYEYIMTRKNYLGKLK